MAKQKVVPPYQLLVDEVTNNPQRGLVLLHQDIATIMNISYIRGALNSKYSSNLSKANKKLTESNLRLESIKGIGYRIIFHNEYVRHVQKAIKMSNNNLEKGLFIKKNTDISKLTSSELAEFDETSKLLTDVYAYLTSALINSNVNLLPVPIKRTGTKNKKSKTKKTK